MLQVQLLCFRFNDRLLIFGSDDNSFVDDITKLIMKMLGVMHGIDLVYLFIALFIHDLYVPVIAVGAL